MAKRIPQQAPAGSLRALGGTGQPFTLGDAELNLRALTEVLNQTPQTVAHIALVKGHAHRDVLQLLLTHRILTSAQHAAIGGALLEMSKADLAGQDISPDNAILWEVIRQCGDQTQEKIRALFNPGDGSIDTVV